MTTNDFDQACRYLLRNSDADLLGWLLGLPASALAFEGWLDTRTLSFPGQPDRTRDTVAFVRDLARGGVPWAVVVEFQLTPDAEMFGRLLVYAGFLWLELRPSKERGDRFEVGAVVVNLTGRGRTARTSVWPEVGLSLGLQPRERNLADEQAAAVLAEVAAGSAPRAVLPFIPLMQGGGDPGIIPEWLRLAAAEPDERRGDFARLTEVFAEAAGCLDVWKGPLRRWSMVVSKVVQEWKAEGKIEGQARMLLRVLASKFGPVPEDLATAIQGVSDQATLDNWGDLAVASGTLEQFRQSASV